MKFSIMYLAGKINGKMDGYRELPSTVLSEETQKKVIEEITIHFEKVLDKDDLQSWKIINEVR